MKLKNQSMTNHLSESSSSYAYELVTEAQGRLQVMKKILDDENCTVSPLHARVHKALILTTEALVCLEALSKEPINE